MSTDGKLSNKKDGDIYYMATSTNKYNLTKPDLSEKVKVEVLNSNMDVIDSAINDLQNQVTANKNTADTNTLNLSNHIDNTSNPHNVTKKQIGLGDVENKSSASIRGELTKNNVTSALGYTPYTPNEIDNKLSDYIPKTGATGITGNLEFANSGTAMRGIKGIAGDNDAWRIMGGATEANGGYLEIATDDDGTEPIYVRQYSDGGAGAFKTLKRTLILLNANGNSVFPGNIDVLGQIKRDGISKSWRDGRDGALVRTTSMGTTQYIPLASIKTNDGSWEIGAYTGNNLWFTYITDANYDAGNNQVTAQVCIKPDGTILASKIESNGEIIGKNQNQFRAIYGSYGVIFRNDGTNTYLLLTKSGDQYGTWTDARPLTINNATGICNINGTADNAKKLLTARNIGDASFNGTSDITLAQMGAVAKSGDTITGQLMVQKGIIIHSSTAREGNTYLKLATFKISGNYTDSPISLEITRRSLPATCKIFIIFQNVNSNDPTLNSFIADSVSDYGVYIHKSATSTWELYVTCPRYDQIDVISFNIPKQSAAIGVTWKDENVSALPSGAIKASFTGNKITYSDSEPVGLPVGSIWI